MSTESAQLNVYRDWLGIPEAELPAEGPPDHYAILRLVRFEDDEDKIRAHQKKLNAHVRTYASGPFSVQSQALMNEITKAMLCLTDPERKRDYDEDLGRVVEEQDVLGRMPLGQWLVRKKVISRDQFREAEAFAEARGLSLRDAVVQMKLVKPDVAARALAQELGLSYVDLNDTVPDDSVLDKLPRGTVKHYSVLPLFVDDDMLLVACVDEPPHDLEDDLRLRYGVPVRWAITTPLAMNQAIAKYYAPGSRESTAELDTVKKSGKSAKSKAAKSANVPFSQLSPGEQHEKRLIGIIVLCWAFIGSALIDTFVIRSFLIKTEWPFFLTLIAAPAAVYYVFRIYWK